MIPVAKPQQCVSAASLKCNESQDSVANMEVCRVCLAMSVKMYHMSEHKLSVMYELVTGIEINSEDNLPKMLCWECVARLSSANNFIEKALKTHWILVNKMDNSKFVTMTDIESIDRAQCQLESTLSVRVYKENYADVFIINESDHYYNDNYNYYNTSGSEFLKHNDIVIKNEEDTEVNVTVEEYPIKREYFDATEEQNVSEEDHISNQKEKIEYQNANIISKVEYNQLGSVSDGEVAFSNVSDDFVICKEDNHIEEGERGVCKGKKRQQEEDGVAPSRSEALPDCKETKLVVKNVKSKNKQKQDSFQQLTVTAQSSKKMGCNIVCRPTNKKQNYGSEYIHKVFVCDTCDRVFQNRKNLIRHIWKPSKVNSCTYCTYKTHSKQYLKEHTNAKHTKSVTYKCEYCSFVTYIKRNLNGHINGKHTKHTVFNCPYCSFKTYHKQCLGTHVNSIHTKSKVFDCSYCSFKTCRKSYLTSHINTKHTKNVSFDCSICSYTTYKKGNLTAHIKSKHSNNSALNCSLCSYRGYDKKALRAHVNSKHTKATVYSCTHCSYETYYSSSFYRHVKRHS